jgi:predicted transglutaminase-like cysteine proteinase
MLSDTAFSQTASHDRRCRRRLGECSVRKHKKGTTHLTTGRLIEILDLKGVESKGDLWKTLIQEVALNLLDLGASSVRIRHLISEAQVSFAPAVH